MEDRNHHGPQPERRLLPHPPAGTSTVDAPGIHLHASHREDFGLLRHPGGECRQGAAVFTGVKTSMELLADRDLRKARHPVAPSWVARLENKAEAALPRLRTALPGLLSEV
jgi:hypothetical protein